MNKLVCMGDSVTYGEFVPSELVWPTLLRDRLPGWRILNRGVCGDTTRLGLERFPRDVQRERPNTVILQFGLNDFNRWETDEGLPRVSANAFVVNLEEMVRRSLHFGASDVIVLTPHRAPGAVKAATEAASMVRAGGFRGQAVRIVDLYDLAAIEITLDDGIHLSEHGHREYARVIGAEL